MTDAAPVLQAVSLRPMSSDDLDQLVEIEGRSHPAPWTRQNFEGEADKPYSTLWVLTDDETDTQVFGYVVFWTMGGGVEILNIVVDPPYRGQGWGKKMLQAVVSEALRGGAERLILDVRKSNLAAVALYQRQGFSITQIRKGFYSNGEDGYHMALDLTALERADFDQ